MHGEGARMHGEGAQIIFAIQDSCKVEGTRQKENKAGDKVEVLKKGVVKGRSAHVVAGKRKVRVESEKRHAESKKDAVFDKVHQAEEEVNGQVFPKRDLSDKELENLSEMVVTFSEKMCGVTLYPYEREFGFRIVYSLLAEDSEEITGLFSRQSGKTETVAVIVCGCIVMLPVLAAALPWESRISKFRNGLWCGIYAPTFEQASIMWKRMKLRMYSKEAKVTLLDPDINIDLTRVTENMALPNGSFVDCGTASPQSQIEGKTYHLILLEETQDITSSKIRGSIHPMAAATAGSIVKIGTPSPRKSDFYDSCRRNKRRDVDVGRIRQRLRLHYEFDYTVAQQYNSKYQKYVTKERDRLGEDSDEFRMKYRLHWILERGMFVNSDLFDECGIKSTKQNLWVEARRSRRALKKGGRPARTTFNRSPSTVRVDADTPGQVAAIDIGKSNSTVITVGKVFWDGPQGFGDDQRYPIHIQNWLELQGDDHEAQHEQIMSFLKNYRLQTVMVDATGKGDPVYSRLAAELDKYGILVLPFLFSAQSKDIGYKILLQELQNRRITYPAGPNATKQGKWQRFYNQMVDLEKRWQGNRMVVSKSLDDHTARDDFPDSLMMLCYLVNAEADQEVEVAPNPLIGRAAKWEIADAMKRTGAWFRRAVNPRGPVPTTRPNKHGKWDQS